MLSSGIPRLIVIEGAPGSGKSMCSQAVAAQLRGHGLPVRWLEEHVLMETTFADLVKAFDANEPALCEHFANCWRSLASEIRESGEIYVTDGAFFADSTQCLFRADLPAEAVQVAVGQVYALTAYMNPLIVYLCGDTRRLVHRAVETRGEIWAGIIAGDVEGYPYQRARGRVGTEGMFQYFTDAQARLRGLLDGCPIRQLHIDTTAGEWSMYLQTVMSELGLEALTEAPSLPDLALGRYAGTYQPPTTFPHPYCEPFTVSAIGPGQLRVDMAFLGGLLLSPQESDASEGRFDVRGKTWTVEFVFDDAGEIIGAIYPFLPKERHLCPKTS